MLLEIDASAVLIFDLDDTLYKEIEFLKSGYRRIADWLVARDFEDPYEEMLSIHKNGGNVFKGVIEKKNFPFTVDQMLSIYREHVPKIALDTETKILLQRIKAVGCKTGLITDGRSITQRNKIRALGIENYFNDVIISEEFGSEKPNPDNFLYFEDKYPNSHFFFFGDNTEKDFIVPRKLGWKTFCLKDNGLNIHSQKIAELAGTEIITSFDEIDIQYTNNWSVRRGD